MRHLPMMPLSTIVVPARMLLGKRGRAVGLLLILKILWRAILRRWLMAMQLRWAHVLMLLRVRLHRRPRLSRLRLGRSGRLLLLWLVELGRLLLALMVPHVIAVPAAGGCRFEPAERGKDQSEAHRIDATSVSQRGGKAVRTRGHNVADPHRPSPALTI
jgi:hypothetical protein